MNEITEFVSREPLFGTHDHQIGFGAMDPGQLGFRQFFAYAAADFATASGRDWNDLSNDEEALFKTWEQVRTTGYGQAAAMGARFLFDLDLTRENAPQIDAAMRAFCAGKTARQSFEDLFARANVIATINDCFWVDSVFDDVFGCHRYPPFFRFALRPDHARAMTVQNRGQIEELERTYQVSIQNLAGLDALLDGIAQRAKATGRLAAIKVAIAYHRALDFDNASSSEAEKSFAALMQDRPAHLKPLHDYQFHRAVQRARDLNVPLQIHTGHLAGNWQDMRNGDPTPLIPIFRQYKQVRFDVFHAAWPYCELMGSVAKEFPNVWLDMCWAWAMSPVQMERVLDEWLAVVPNNKIFLFGADTGNPFAEVGYAQQARRGLARVLSKKISSGEYDLPTARYVARRLMHENPAAFFSP